MSCVSCGKLIPYNSLWCPDHPQFIHVLANCCYDVDFSVLDYAKRQLTGAEVVDVGSIAAWSDGEYSQYVGVSSNKNICKGFAGFYLKGRLHSTKFALFLMVSELGDPVFNLETIKACFT